MQEISWSALAAEVRRGEDRQAQIAEAHDARMEALEDALLRLLGTGNGAAILATLGLIGTIIGRSEDGLAPRGLFWLLIIFLVGLFGVAWWHTARLVRTSDSFRAKFHLQRPKYERRAKIHRATERVAASVASLALTGGIIYGLFQLFLLTSP